MKAVSKSCSVGLLSTIKAAVICLILAQSFADLAHACDEFISLEDLQVRELVAVSNSSNSSELEQALAFETLMCAKRASIRDMAVRASLKSASKSVRARGLLEVIMNRDSMIVETMIAEGLSEKQYDFIKKTNHVAYAFHHKNKQLGCASFSRFKECKKGDMLDISGLRVSFISAPKGSNKFTGSSGHFDLDASGEYLIGWFRPGKDDFSVPARIPLF